MTFNLDAVEVEASGKPFVFTFGGEKYTIDAPPDVQGAAMLERGEVSAAMERLLGEEQWARIIASDEVLDGNRFAALFEAMGDHFGVDAGKSSGSSRSSKNTAGRSRQI